MPRAHPPLRAPPGSGAPGGRLRPQREGRAGWFGEATAARSPMRARGARDGFGWRRRLRGRRARGGPASPAALPDRGERRHRERQGKGLGGPAGPVPCPRDSRPPGTPGDPIRPPSRGKTRPWQRRCPLPAWAGRGAEGRGADPERLACPRGFSKAAPLAWPSGPPGPCVPCQCAAALLPSPALLSLSHWVSVLRSEARAEAPRKGPAPVAG